MSGVRDARGEMLMRENTRWLWHDVWMIYVIIYKVVNIIQEQAIELNIYCILFYKLSSSVTSNSQNASKIHQTPFYSIQPTYNNS